MPELDCETPKDNLKVMPCLSCLSEKELQALLIYIMSELFASYSLPDDMAALMEDSACYTCMSKKQLMQVTVTIWATMLYGERQEIPDINTLRDEIKCLLCSTPAQLDAALAQVTCGLIVWGA